MRTLEVRRHSVRKDGGGSQLSQAGVDLARRLGASMGPFARVVASVVPRARETALAMGFAVDHELVTLVAEDEAHAELEQNRWWEAELPFAALAELLAARGALYRYGHAQAALWRDVMNAIPDGASALLISHSGEIELALAACFPRANHAAWGAPFGPCEGARLTYDGEPARFTACELLRLGDSSGKVTARVAR